LDDLDAQGGADRIAILGDVALLGPDPGEVVEMLIAQGAEGIRGNIDRFLLDIDWRACDPAGEEEQADQALCLWALEQLGERAERWLRALPFERELAWASQRVLLMHGSPRSDTDAVSADTPNEDIREMIAGAHADVILCGHTHQPLDRTVDAVRLINPGAVGYPQGEPGTARYAVLTWEEAWRVEFRTVPYDVERTISRLMAAQRPYRVWVAETLRRAEHIPLTTLE
jgi:predicted phosphodiesterase